MASRLCEVLPPQLRPFVAFNEEREPADVLDSDVRASLREVVSPTTTTTTLCVSTAKLLATTHTHTVLAWPGQILHQPQRLSRNDVEW